MRFESLKANAKFSWTALLDFAMRHHTADSKLDPARLPPTQKKGQTKDNGETSFFFFGPVLLGPLCYLATR
jgi:hypothetical protein